MSYGIVSKEDFGRNLTYYIERSGKSQREIADILNIPQPSLNSWCRGKKFPRIDKIEMLCDYFGCTKSDLIEKKTGAEADLSVAKRKLIDLAKDCSEDDAERLLQMFQLVLGRQ